MSRLADLVTLHDRLVARGVLKPTAQPFSAHSIPERRRLTAAFMAGDEPVDAAVPTRRDLSSAAGIVVGPPCPAGSPTVGGPQPLGSGSAPGVSA